MKKIGSKVLLMMVLFVVIFGLNTITSVRSQNRVKRSGLEITEQYIPIQTEIFTIQKSMERGQKYLNIISLYDNAELRQQLEGSLAEEVSTITESEKKIDVYLKDNNNTKLKDAIKKYEEFLDKVLLQFSTKWNMRYWREARRQRLRLWYMIPARLKKVLCLCASAEVCVMHMSLFRMWQQREQRPLS